MEHVDTVVIGGGVVGLACAQALAARGAQVWLLERERLVGSGVSARNSEVLHAGIYYANGSNKARWCVQGREALVAFCQSHGVPYRLCGKLIVATHNDQRPALQALAARAQANGVTLQWLEAEAARELEPALACVAALHSPHTGIVDSHALMLALQGELEARGGVVALGAEVVSGVCGPAGVQLQVRTDDGDMELHAQRVVNAAALHAVQVAQRLRGMPPEHVPHAYFARGHYFTYSGKAPFTRLIYPAPQDAWLGIHLTLDLAGQARFGPDQQWLPEVDVDALRYDVDPALGETFEASVRRYWPGLPPGSLQPSYAGIRPRIFGPGQPAADFRVDGPSQHGVPGLVHLFGIESPGLTSSLAIAQHVADTLGLPP